MGRSSSCGVVTAENVWSRSGTKFASLITDESGRGLHNCTYWGTGSAKNFGVVVCICIILIVVV